MAHMVCSSLGTPTYVSCSAFKTGPDNGRTKVIRRSNEASLNRRARWLSGTGRRRSSLSTLLANVPRSTFQRTRMHINCIVVTDPSAVQQSAGDKVESLIAVPPLPQITESKRFVLVRHGESTWNATGRIQGSSDFSVLTPKGEGQAETSRQMLMADKFEVCFHSPLARSARTAEIIWGSRQEAMVPLLDLREIDLYSFQGLFKEEGKARFGPAYLAWQKDAANFEIDKHYPVRELWERARACWEVMLQHPARTVLVVAHNAVNQALVATATGLGPTYFRQLLQSNCGVSVLDFSVRPNGAAPHVCLNRLNQTPNPPIVVGQAAGRKAKSRVVLVCHGATESSAQERVPFADEEKLTMLGVIQARKVAELLLDVRVDALLCSPLPRAVQTAQAIAEVQEAAECLGAADCAARYLDVLELPELRDLRWGAWRGVPTVEIGPRDGWTTLLRESSPKDGEGLETLWERAGKAWAAIIEELNRQMEIAAGEGDADSGPTTLVVVSHDLVHSAILGHCLELSQDCIGSFHLDTGSLSVIDFPDGGQKKGVVRCLNYTAHLGRWAVPVTRPTANEEDF